VEMAKILVRQKKIEDAIQQYQKIIDRYPQSPYEAFFFQGELYEEPGSARAGDRGLRSVPESGARSQTARGCSGEKREVGEEAGQEV